jgi:hypothetical protein
MGNSGSLAELSIGTRRISDHEQAQVRWALGVDFAPDGSLRRPGIRQAGCFAKFGALLLIVLLVLLSLVLYLRRGAGQFWYSRCKINLDVPGVTR